MAHEQMSQYRVGARAEYRARDELLADPRFHTVLRMAGSKGPADLVAVGPDCIAFVQVKTTVKSKPNYKAELEAFRAWPVPDNCIKEMRIELRHRRAWVIMAV